MFRYVGLIRTPQPPGSSSGCTVVQPQRIDRPGHENGLSVRPSVTLGGPFDKAPSSTLWHDSKSSGAAPARSMPFRRVRRAAGGARARPVLDNRLYKTANPSDVMPAVGGRIASAVHHEHAHEAHEHAHFDHHEKTFGDDDDDGRG